MLGIIRYLTMKYNLKAYAKSTFPGGKCRLYIDDSNNFRLSKLWSIAETSKDEVGLYVFVTAAGKGGTLGKAYVGTVCKTDKVYRRISINRYGRKEKGKAQKNKVSYTAEVIFHLF